ncbi:hypothetical protein [Streptomyces yangpuensis]|uniref:hypothetical protein n=1 Tax=Streptomyces yangpuensis TaxID=1648182 RepID=UPI0037F486EF
MQVQVKEKPLMQVEFGHDELDCRARMVGAPITAIAESVGVMGLAAGTSTVRRVTGGQTEQQTLKGPSHAQRPGTRDS